MRSVRPTFQLWHIMLTIAVIAGLFAALGVVGAMAILVVIAVLVLPVVLAGPRHRLRAAAWVASLYPVLIVCFTYATWFTAWAVLGHRPRMWQDDPTFISQIVDVPLYATYLLILGLPCALVLCLLLVLAFVAQGVGRDGVGPSKAAAQLLIPTLLWISPSILSLSVLFEFTYVYNWVMD